eukprot:363130-Chlamydomonas_euryale.AAC.4
MSYMAAAAWCHQTPMLSCRVEICDTRLQEVINHVKRTQSLFVLGHARPKTGHVRVAAPNLFSVFYVLPLQVTCDCWLRSTLAYPIGSAPCNSDSISDSMPGLGRAEPFSAWPCGAMQGLGRLDVLTWALESVDVWNWVSASDTRQAALGTQGTKPTPTICNPVRQHKRRKAPIPRPTPATPSACI